MPKIWYIITSSVCFFVGWKVMALTFTSLIIFAIVLDPTVPVRGLNATVTVVVQDKYARMLVLQGHCPLVCSVRAYKYNHLEYFSLFPQLVSQP